MTMTDFWQRADYSKRGQGGLYAFCDDFRREIPAFRDILPTLAAALELTINAVYGLRAYPPVARRGVSMLPPFRPLSSSLDLQGAFAQLSRDGFASCSLDETLRQLTAATARMLNVERVGLWGLTARRASLECIDLYELSRDRHSSGVTLHAARYPEYFRALVRGEPIVADDAMKHPSTQEFGSVFAAPS